MLSPFWICSLSVTDTMHHRAFLLHKTELCCQLQQQMQLDYEGEGTSIPTNYRYTRSNEKLRGVGRDLQVRGGLRDEAPAFHVFPSHLVDGLSS